LAAEFVAMKGVEAAKAELAAVEARLAADAANYLHPPAANAKELSLAAGLAERKAAVVRAEQALMKAAAAVSSAQRAATDDKGKKALADAEKARDAAQKAVEAAQKAVETPNENYTRFTPVHATTSTGRRLSLARWITARDNPLAARVAVNHLWLRHFGSPLVPSVFDFGLNGKPPTNQPLLDWLAVDLMENGWRMKGIHKQIVMSRTYKLASTARMANDQASMTKDPENLYYWRANVRRMEAEVVRDATLHVAGSLDLARGGPDIDQGQALSSPRRSLYFRASKEKRVEFLSLFDSPNPTECYRRSESIAPQQALAMANSPLALAQARKLAGQLTAELKEPGKPDIKNSPRFVDSAFTLLLCRPPTEEERKTCEDFLFGQSLLLGGDRKSWLAKFDTGPDAAILPSKDPLQRARENLVHVLLNHNDFVTIR
jgi:hypothetical protein